MVENGGSFEMLICSISMQLGFFADIDQAMKHCCDVILRALKKVRMWVTTRYCKDTEPLYHAFMYSLLGLLSGIYPFTQCLSLLVTNIIIQPRSGPALELHSRAVSRVG